MDANEYALKVEPAKKSLGLVLRNAVYLGEGPEPSRSLRPLTDQAPAEPEPPVAQAATSPTSPRRPREQLKKRRSPRASPSRRGRRQRRKSRPPLLL